MFGESELEIATDDEVLIEELLMECMI